MVGEAVAVVTGAAEAVVGKEQDVVGVRGGIVAEGEYVCAARAR
ncbi:hypothetical protein ABZ820_36795 [Streptomyces diacarni]